MCAAGRLASMQTQRGPCTGFRAAVVVPSFNHGRSIGLVLDGLGRLGLPIVVVDDGSTDDTRSAVSLWSTLNPAVAMTFVRHETNVGKAAALRSGFGAAASLGMSHAVSIDADGQLDPGDIPALLSLSRAHPTALILGTRPADTPDCPPRCLAGRLFASFAIALQTGLHLSDSQCGLRIYPLQLIETLACRGGRYAFEAEMITRTAWAGWPVLEQPVTCRYFREAERVSHFRPWRDTCAQVGMHIRLIARALLPLPRVVRREAPSRRVVAFLAWLDPRRAWNRSRASTLGMLETGAALGFGVWVGLWPLSGGQVLPALFLAWRLHLHPAATLLGVLAAAGPAGAALHDALAGMAPAGGTGGKWIWRCAAGVIAGFGVGFAAFWAFAGAGLCLRVVRRLAAGRPGAPGSGRAPAVGRAPLAEPAP